MTTSNCKIGDKVCTFYGGQPLYIVRWHEDQEIIGTEHSGQPAQSVGAAFAPRLMEAHQAGTARLGPDEDFIIR